MKYFGFLFLLIILSCTKKDEGPCYICTTTYIVTTDNPVPGYPRSESIQNRFCDIDDQQIEEFELVNKGSDVTVISGVTYSSSYSTACTLER
jgi:hypothetical protein